MSNTGEAKVSKQKGIEVIKNLAYELKDQQANLYDRLVSLKSRTIGDSPLSSDEGKGSDAEDNSLAVLEVVLRVALSYGNNCHSCVSDLDEEL